MNSFPITSRGASAKGMIPDCMFDILLAFSLLFLVIDFVLVNLSSVRSICSRSVSLIPGYIPISVIGSVSFVIDLRSLRFLNCVSLCLVNLSKYAELVSLTDSPLMVASLFLYFSFSVSTLSIFIL